MKAWGSRIGSLALAVGLAFPLLDLAGFAAEGSGDGGLAMLVALYALVPVALKLVAIALMWNFPLDAGAHAELARSLAERNERPGRPRA